MESSRFTRIVRFNNPRGVCSFGELGDVVAAAEDLIGRKVPIYEGMSPWDDNLTLTERIEEISEVSCISWSDA